MKKLLKKSLLASVILATGSAAGIVYISNTLMTEDNSSDFSTSPLAYNVLSEDQLKTYSQSSSYVTAVKGNQKEIVSQAQSDLDLAVSDFKYSVKSERGIDSTVTDPITIDELPTDQPGDLNAIQDWLETEAGQSVADIIDLVSTNGLSFISDIPNTDFGKKVQEVHAEYETYFYANVSSDTTYRDNWNDPLYTDPFDFDPKTATWTDWAFVPSYLYPLMVYYDKPVNGGPGIGYADEAEIKEYYSNIVFDAVSPQMLINDVTPSEIEYVTIDKIDLISATEIEEIINSWTDGDLPTLTAPVIPHIPSLNELIGWTPMEHVKSIYEYPFFASTPHEEVADGTVSQAIIDDVHAKITAAVEAAMPGQTALQQAVLKSIFDAIDGPLATLAGEVEDLYNAYILAVKAIDDEITAFNLRIDILNAKMAAIDLRIVEINEEIDALNTKIATLVDDVNVIINDINAGLTADWDAIEALVNNINTFIEAINVKIDEINAQLVIAIDAINAEIAKQFGQIDIYVQYINDTIAYVYESVWYYTSAQIAEQTIVDNLWHIPGDKDPIPTNSYQDSTGNTQYHPSADGVSTMEDSEFPFTEVSITDDNGTTDVDTTNPIYTETTSETYSTSFTISVREGGDYADFDADNIKIYSWVDNSGEDYPDFAGATEHTFSYVKNPTALATGRSTDYVAGGAKAYPDAATYDVYEYTFTVNDLKAGEEYYFYMEANNFADPEVDALYNGIENSVKVNHTPVIHYMNNDVTLKAGTENITEVSGAATFEILDDGKYWNLEEDDIQVVTTLTGDPAEIAPTTFKFTDGASGAPATLELAYSGDGVIVPDTSYTTTISTRPYDTDDSTWISEDGPFVEQLVVTWTTLPWKAPQPPTVEIVDPGKDSLADKKHTRQLDYTITTPGADIYTGQDITEITSIDVYVGLGDYSTVGMEPSKYDMVHSITDITNNGGAAEAVEEASYLIEGLELGTQYTAYIDVQFRGLNDNTQTGNVESNKVVFTTEGLDPALPPYFGDEVDETDGLTFVSATTDSITLAFDFTDPATPNDDTTNTKIESIDYYVEESATGITAASTPWTDVTVVYDGGISGVDNTTDNRVDVQYTGQVTFNGLDPNMNYDFRMDLNSNAIPDIDSDPDLDKITIESPIATGKTLKLDALSPEWDATKPFEFTERTENTMSFHYDFVVPENDLVHKNTFFDSIAVYIGDNGVTNDGLDSELTEADYTITPDDSEVIPDAGPAGETNGHFQGDITFLNLLPNTTYTFQLGIRSHWYDDDNPTATPTDMPEVFSPYRVETTAKLSAKGPWFDETTGGLEFVESSVVAPVAPATENTIQATISYKFYLPPTDSDYFDTIFNNEFKILLSSTFGGGEAEYEATDFTVTEEAQGELTSGLPEHTFVVAAADGTEYTTTTTEGLLYSGTIVLNNLHPEETYTAKMVVSTDSSNPDVDIDGNPVDVIDDITSDPLSFPSHTLPPEKPYFGKEDDESDGVQFVRDDKWSDTAISFDFDFTIPEKKHGYQQGIFNDINVYFGTDSSSLALAELSKDYTIEFTRLGTDNGDGTYGSGLFQGTVTFTGLNANTTYFVQLGIISNYYEGVDETVTTEVLSPIVSGATASTAAVPPVITNASVAFDKNKSRFILSMDVRNFNGESDPLGSVADTLNDVIHVGSAEMDSSGNYLDDMDAIVDDPYNNADKIATSDKDYYLTTEYTVKADENGAGEEFMHYDISLKTDSLPFESTINNMIISLEWKDDGTSYEDLSGTVKYLVPAFDTPDIETITPEFESVYTTNEQAKSVDVTYNIGLLDPSVVPNPNPDGDSTYIDEAEIWQTETVINRISVAAGTHDPVSSSSTRTDGPIDPTLPPVAPDENEAIYDSNTDPDWEAGLFGTFTLNNLYDGSRYTGVTIYAEYDSFRPTDVDDPTALPVSSGTIGFEMDPFETEFIDPLTPTIDTDDPLDWLDHDGFDPLFPVDVIDPETVDPVDPVDPGDKEEGVNVQRIIWILLLILFTGITIAAVLYPMLKED